MLRLDALLPFALIVVMPCRLVASGTWLTTEIVTPPSPTTSDSIAVAITGRTPTACYSTPTAVVSRVNNTVDVALSTVSTLQPGEVCNQIVQPFVVPVTIGYLPAGSYTVDYTFSIGGQLSETDTEPLSVSSGPPTGGLLFVPVTPCRVMDTRAGSGKAGAFGPPSMAAGSSRDIPIPAGGCGVPSTAQAYSLQVTVAPSGSLSYLSLWPAGQEQQVVSTLNSYDGRVVGNAAIVPAGVSAAGPGAVTVYVTDATDVIMDVNGYFAPPGSSGLAFYTVPPCRLVDTRAGNGETGAFGPPAIAGGSHRDIPIPAGGCGIPSTAQAYALNVTAVPHGPLGYLTAWPTGQPQPFVSLANDPGGEILANMAIVAAGTPSGAVSLYATDTTDVVVDISGYFAPVGAAGTGAGPLLFFAMTPCRGSDWWMGPTVYPSFGWPESPDLSFLPDPSAVWAIPQGVAAYSFNVTVAPQGSLMYLTLGPTPMYGQAAVSTLNSLSGRVVANAALVPGGFIFGYATADTVLILDINGYFAPGVQ